MRTAIIRRAELRVVDVLRSGDERGTDFLGRLNARIQRVNDADERDL